MASVLSGLRYAAILTTVLGILYLGYSALQSLFIGSSLLRSEQFTGVVPLGKPVTNVIVVHGIGNHCIGYADKLITNLAGSVSKRDVPTIEDSYREFTEAARQAAQTRSVKEEADAANQDFEYQISGPESLLDGHCKRLDDGLDAGEKVTEWFGTKGAPDLEARMISQDDFCRFINGEPLEAGAPILGRKDPDRAEGWSCHLLRVHRDQVSDPRENRDYVTGFVRRLNHKVSEDRTLRIFELTWSPATRWIKKSLDGVEQHNNTSSDHWLNRELKSNIVNGGIADAVAYLSDSGVLVNYNVLQAFCLSLADLRKLTGDYKFTCDSNYLSAAVNGSFSQHHDVILISHSLGTRVLFDTIGLLSRGAGATEAHLLDELETKFGRIGARFPGPQGAAAAGLTEAQLAAAGAQERARFAALLKPILPEFSRAIRAAFAITNQVPLLAANLTSPFQEQRYDVGDGFREFLKIRMAEDAVAQGVTPMQLVAFHDPDDLLSYNLSCWYHLSVLRKLRQTKQAIHEEAMARSKKDQRRLGTHRVEILAALERDACIGDGQISDRDRRLKEIIWQHEGQYLRMVDAAVRLRGLRMKWAFASPLDVHSNYFDDERVHQWLAFGNDGTR